MGKHSKTVYMVGTIQVNSSFWAVSDIKAKLHDDDYSDYVQCSSFSKYTTGYNRLMPKLYPAQIESAEIPANATLTSFDYNIQWCLSKTGEVTWEAKQGYETYSSTTDGANAPNNAGSGTLTGTSKETKTFSFVAPDNLATTGSSVTFTFKNTKTTSNRIRLYRCDCTLHYTIPDYVITANATVGGSVTGGGTYEVGSTATLTATPNTGYKFKQWSDGNTNSTRTITVTANVVYTAEFVVDKVNKVYDGIGLVKGAYVGSSPVKAVYIGNTKIYG